MRRRRHQRNEPEIEDNKDMLSDLPDCVTLHILSFLNARDAVKTCLLSTRWKHLWKRLSILNLSYSDFSTDKCFVKFVKRILSLRDSSTALNTLDFECGWGWVECCLVKRIVRYATSHDVNRLRIACHIMLFPSCLSCESLTLSCQSLTSLELESEYVKFPNSVNLPALTYLKLHYVCFLRGNDGRVEPFSTFKRLNTLIIHNCTVQDAKPLYISSTALLNLSIHATYTLLGYSNIELFAPSLRTFAITYNFFQKLSGSHLSSIQQVMIIRTQEDTTTRRGVRALEAETTLNILNLLIEMTDIKSLTVCPRTLQGLSLVPDILKLKLPFLCNMKSLKLNVSCDSYRFSTSSWRDIKMELAQGKSWKENVKLREAIKAGLEPVYSSIIDGMIQLLLQNSPLAKVDVVSVK